MGSCMSVCVCWVGGEKKKKGIERDKDAWQRQTGTHAVYCMSMHVCEADITFILHQFLHVVYTPRCNKQKIRKERNGKKKKKKKKERRRDNHRETDDDDRRNWIWVKDSKPLSLNANIKGLVGRGENMEL